MVGKSSSRLVVESPSSGRCWLPSIGIVTETGVLTSVAPNKAPSVQNVAGADQLKGRFVPLTE